MKKSFIFISILFSSTLLMAQQWTLGESEASVISTKGLNLREKPDPESSTICVIPFMENVDIIKHTEISFEEENVYTYFNSEGKPVEKNLQGIWIKVKYGNYEGYAFSAYLRNLKFRYIDKKYNKKYSLKFMGGDCVVNIHTNTKLNWYGIYENGNEYSLKKVELFYFNDREPATFSTVTNDNKNLLFVIGNESTKIIEGAISGKNWGGWQGDFFDGNGNRVAKPKNLEINSDYGLVLKSRNIEQLISDTFGPPEKIIWNGDLDGDNEEDYIISFGSDHNRFAVLFLSSEAENDELVKAVAIFQFGYCC